MARERAMHERRSRDYARIKVEKGLELQMLSRKAQENDAALRERIDRLSRDIQGTYGIVYGRYTDPSAEFKTGYTRERRACEGAH